MTPDERARNSIASHALALAACRMEYLRNRLPGETAAQYRQRVTPHPFPPLRPYGAYPRVTQDHIGGPIRLTLYGGTTTTLSPQAAITLGAQLCALGAAELALAVAHENWRFL